MAAARSILLACIAGTSANSTVVIRHTPALSARTRQSISAGRLIMIPAGMGANSSLIRLRHQFARRSPPGRGYGRQNQSLRSEVAATGARRPAPRESRTVISWRRENDRTSNKLPTLAHAISKHQAGDDERDPERGQQSAGIVERRLP